MVLKAISTLLCANRFVFRTKRDVFREPLQHPPLEIDKHLSSLVITTDNAQNTPIIFWDFLLRQFERRPLKTTEVCSCFLKFTAMQADLDSTPSKMII